MQSEEFANILEEHDKYAFLKKYGFLRPNQMLKTIHKSNLKLQKQVSNIIELNFLIRIFISEVHHQCIPQNIFKNKIMWISCEISCMHLLHRPFWCLVLDAGTIYISMPGDKLGTKYKPYIQPRELLLTLPELTLSPTVVILYLVEITWSYILQNSRQY